MIGLIFMIAGAWSGAMLWIVLAYRRRRRELDELFERARQVVDAEQVDQ